MVGEPGGGAVRVTMSGRMRVIAVELDPALCAGLGAGEPARQMAQSLIAEAMNEAAQKAQALMESIVAKASREMGLPDMPGLGGLLSG